MMKIYFQKGKRAGESLEFPPPGVFIGREEDNDIQLLVDGVSQYHAKIMFGDEGWVLHDLDSSNGTRVNGKRVEKPLLLKSGDMIYIAKEALKIEYDEKKKEQAPVKEEIEKTVDVLDIDKDDGVKIRNPEESKKPLPPEEAPKSSAATKVNQGKIPKKSKEQRAQEREINRLVQEAIREKKKRLTIISIIIAVVANLLIFLWWYSKL